MEQAKHDVDKCRILCYGFSLKHIDPDSSAKLTGALKEHIEQGAKCS